MSTRTISLLLVVGLLPAACGEPATDATTTTAPTSTETTAGSTTSETTATTDPIPERPDSLTVISHDSFAGGVVEETFEGFTAATGIEVEVLPAGDAGSMVNQAILTKDNPLADVLFGVDDTFLSRALEAGIFEPYSSSRLTDVPDDLELDPAVTPIDFGDVCINYDRSVYAGAAPPLNLEQLALPEFANQLVVENPVSSSPGLAFLLATIATFGEDGWQDYWRDLVANGVKVVPDWDTAYYSESTWWGGDRPLVVSYASSPPAEVIFAEEPLDEAPTGVIDESCYRQIEFAGILAGSDYPEAAGELIDFMLSPEFQRQIPLTWFVFPANETVALPAEFVEHTVIPSAPRSIDPADIDANRERWLEEWTQIVIP